KKASALAKHFLGDRAEQLDLFEDRLPVETVRIRTDQVRVEGGRAFGDAWLGWLLWQALDLDQFCNQVLPEGRAKVRWADLAMILVVARLCEPSSELHVAEDWYRRVALEDLVGIPPEDVYHTRLYRALDQLLPHKRALEIHLKNRLGTLFGLEYDLLLYDVTSTYFEGEAKQNPLAQRGYSRDRRPDCKQVCIGLVVTREGFPIGYEVFAGNTTDVTTVEEIVEEMEGRYGKAKRVWVMDRGMVSEEILVWLREDGREYLVGTPRSELGKWERELVEREGWRQIREDLEVKLCQGSDGLETFILCRSAARLEKEKAIHERFRERIREELQRLSRRLERAKKPADPSQVERQIGRILERNGRAAGGFQVKVEEDTTRPSGLRVDVTEKTEWDEWVRLTAGTYLLRSNVKDWSAEDLWRTYIQLTEAEAAFRIQKSDLRIRPIWHHKEDRVLAHILVCFLAYVLWKTLSGWQQRARLGSSPRTILEEFRRIQSVDVVLPTDGGPELRVRCVVRPDDAQATLLARLGLRLPRRLRGHRLPAAM
ncbi:MAG: IS1634 family transposase, partial [Candidatus Methylomirabilales bacterium]